MSSPTPPTATTPTLLPVSGYPGGVFGCDACNRYGDGFNYHCSICEFNPHPICAHKPCNFTHQFHSCPLKLIFKNPYNSRFWCDICRDSIESNEWRYRCNACDFDIHLHCTAACPAQPMVQGGKAQLLRWQHPRIPGGILINNQKQIAGSLVPQRINTDSSVMRGGGQNIGSSNTAQFLQPQVGSAVQSKNSNALANAWVQGGAQQLGSMAVHGLIGGQRDRDGDGTEDGVNDVLDILGNLLLT
ncbi:hypothetical protein ACH5RR_025231 [Cinchona calisaya]|uniref:Phorbol-ester/DAG-type domain-containing protein n=1 Tax=Cinchona calisaya TaxID=153742 RepID=A0ABD2Z1J2_9GENT